MVNIHKIFLSSSQPPCPRLLPPHFFLSHPFFPPQAFSFLPLLLILSLSVTHHHSSLPPLPPVSCLSFPTPSLSSFLLLCACVCVSGGAGGRGVGRLRLLWTAAIRPIGGIGRPQKHTDLGSEPETGRDDTYPTFNILSLCCAELPVYLFSTNGKMHRGLLVKLGQRRLTS